MKCGKCGVSVMERPLERINEKGIDGIFWCWPCIDLHEPELGRNLREDQSDVEKLIITDSYPKPVADAAINAPKR